MSQTEQPQGVCWCSHVKSSHYQYIRNGEEATKCKDCDPFRDLPPGNYGIESGSDFDKRYRESTHDYVEVEYD